MAANITHVSSKSHIHDIQGSENLITALGRGIRGTRRTTVRGTTAGSKE